jgi:hypothetical protein
MTVALVEKPKTMAYATKNHSILMTLCAVFIYLLLLLFLSLTYSIYMWLLDKRAISRTRGCVRLLSMTGRLHCFVYSGWDKNSCILFY